MTEKLDVIEAAAAAGAAVPIDAAETAEIVETVGTVGTVDATRSSIHSDDSPTLNQLEQEGDIAADYIEEFLDICDLDGDIDIDARNGRAYLSVNASDGENLRVLSKPDTVNALQELTRLAIQSKTGSFSRLILDIGGSRDARQAELSALVGRAIERIEAGAADAGLPPMSSYERKLVQDIVAERGYL